MFRVGQKVVCIEGSNVSPAGELALVKGEIYSIREVITYKNHIGLRLNEIVNPIVLTVHGKMERFYYSHLFRPVTYISDSEFEELEKELNKEEYAKI